MKQAKIMNLFPQEDLGVTRLMPHIFTTNKHIQMQFVQHRFAENAPKRLVIALPWEFFDAIDEDEIRKGSIDTI